MADNPILIVRGLEVSWGGRVVLRLDELDLQPGELIGIVGPNGAGKTTLLRALAGIVRPQRGVILLRGRNLQSLSAREVAREMGYLPQVRSSYEDLTVHELARRGLLPLGHLPSHVASRAVNDVLELCALRGLEHQRLSAISGGESQRAWLAFVLIRRPRVLLLDEPTSHLDYRHQMELLELLRRLCQEGAAVAIAIHDLWLASRHCHRLVVLHQGECAAVGPPEEVLTPQLLQAVFGVEATMAHLPDGSKVCFPISPAQGHGEVLDESRGRRAPERA